MKQVRLNGLSQFLAEYFIQKPELNLIPKTIVQRLIKHKNVGKIVHGRRSVVKAPEVTFIEVTVLQLIASEITKLKTLETLETDYKQAVAILNLVLAEDYIDPFILSDKELFS